MSILISTLIFIAVIFLILKFKGSKFGTEPSDNTSRPDVSKKPNIEKDNDKLIVVSNVNHNDVKNALVKFCNMYNNENYAALPRLVQLSPDTFAITFPYDVEFSVFCFAVNFMGYPTDITWNSKVTAWATTKAGDEWIIDEIKGKKVMLFLAEGDKEYDDVFLTTSENIGYKLGFAARKAKVATISTPAFADYQVDLNSIKGLKFEDIE